MQTQTTHRAFGRRLAALLGFVLCWSSALLAAPSDFPAPLPSASDPGNVVLELPPVAGSQQPSTFSAASPLNTRETKPAANADPAKFKIGYADGLFFESKGDPCNDVLPPFRLRVNSWFQLRHTGFHSNGPNPDQNDIEFERLRLSFAGHVFAPEVAYFFQLDGDSDQGSTSDWLDYFTTIDFGKYLWGLDSGRLGFRAGKWKLPFNRARRESGWKMEFSDRTVASVFFDINRSNGAGLLGKIDVLEGEVFWESAVFNGIKTGGFRSARQNELDENFGYSGRIFSDLWGEWGRDGEPDLSCRCTPAVRAGAGFAYSRVDRIEGAREFDVQRVVDSGATLGSIVPAAVTTYDVALQSVDLNYKNRGLSVHTEVYFRQLANMGAGVPDLFDHGFMLQTGYFLKPEKFQILGRWSRVAGNSGTLGGPRQSADEIAAGATWYFRGHEAKLTFDVTHLNGAPIRDLALNILPGDAGWLYRTQLQMKF